MNLHRLESFFILKSKFLISKYLPIYNSSIEYYTVSIWYRYAEILHKPRKVIIRLPSPCAYGRKKGGSIAFLDAFV